MSEIMKRTREFTAWPATHGDSLKGTHRHVNRTSGKFTHIQRSGES